MNARSQLNALLNKGKGAEARRIIRTRLKEFPDDHWLMSKMAQAYEVEGRLSKALEWSRRAVSLAPR